MCAAARGRPRPSAGTATGAGTGIRSGPMAGPQRRGARLGPCAGWAAARATDAGAMRPETSCSNRQRRQAPAASRLPPWRQAARDRHGGAGHGRRGRQALPRHGNSKNPGGPVGRFSHHPRRRLDICPGLHSEIARHPAQPSCGYGSQPGPGISLASRRGLRRRPPPASARRASPPSRARARARTAGLSRAACRAAQPAGTRRGRGTG